MSCRNRLGLALACLCVGVLIQPTRAADGAAEQQNLQELRNTVVNLLQALVEKGLLTREQAQQLVKQAQDKAQADAAVASAKAAEAAKEEQGAVRVPYVPQIVKDEIGKQVAQEVKPAVEADVLKAAKTEGWGIPGALPEWLSRVKVFGDLTLRYQGDIFAGDNVANSVFDFNAINQAGGYSKTTFPYLDTTHDRNRLRLRARLGVEAQVSEHLKAYIRLASGSLTDPGSESQTFGTYAERYTVGIDQAFLVWNSNLADRLSHVTLQGGRMTNPWFAPTELVYARDLTFEGAASTFRFGWGGGGSDQANVYATLGGFPVLEVPLVNQDNKWLVGGQIGTNLRWADGGSHLRFAAAYYDFLHVTGRINDPNAPGLTNYTAPAFLRTGNTVFDIANNPLDPTQNLFALAAHFRLVDLAANYEQAVGPFSLAVSGEAVRNIGYNLTAVENLSGQTMPSSENKGYVGEVSFGHPLVDRFGKWRVVLGYRYVKRDAVLDAWTDADFHEGGTNTEGYYVWTMFGLANNTWLRLRYLSGNEVDGPRYGLDVLQLDINARF